MKMIQNRILSLWLAAKARPLYSVLGTLFVLGLVWYFFGPEKKVPVETLTVQKGEFVNQVTVSGKVKAAQQVDLGFSQSGRIVSVAAKVGRVVARGTTLAQVENGDLRAAVSQRLAALASQQAKLRSLEAGTRPESIAVTESQVASARTALQEAQIALQNELLEAYTVSDSAVHNTIDQFLSNPRSQFPLLLFPTSDSQLESNFLAARVTAEDMLVRWGGASDATPVLVRTNVQKTVTLLEQANAVLVRGLSNQSTTQSTLNAWIASVGTARTTVNASLAAVTAAVTAEKNAQSALTTAENNLKLAQAGSTVGDLDVQRAQVQSAVADVAAARAQLAKTIITAPFTGTVTKVDAKTGQIASGNTPLISMIGRGTFEIETFIPELVISRVKIGDPATVSLDSIPDTVFVASVIAIDPAETVRDGVASYKVTLEFEKNDERLKSGLTADVVITTEKRQDVLMIPENAVSEKDNAFVVTVPGGKEGETSGKTVVTGSVSSTGMIEIVSGLSEGETIIVPVQE